MEGHPYRKRPAEIAQFVDAVKADSLEDELRLTTELRRLTSQGLFQGLDDGDVESITMELALARDGLIAESHRGKGVWSTGVAVAVGALATAAFTVTGLALIPTCLGISAAGAWMLRRQLKAGADELVAASLAPTIDAGFAEMHHRTMDAGRWPTTGVRLASSVGGTCALPGDVPAVTLPKGKRENE